MEQKVYKTMKGAGAANIILGIVTIVLGLCVGATANADTFLDLNTLLIFALGILAFAIEA